MTGHSFTYRTVSSTALNTKTPYVACLSLRNRNATTPLCILMSAGASEPDARPPSGSDAWTMRVHRHSKTVVFAMFSSCVAGIAICCRKGCYAWSLPPSLTYPYLLNGVHVYIECMCLITLVIIKLFLSCMRNRHQARQLAPPHSQPRALRHGYQSVS